MSEWKPGDVAMVTTASWGGLKGRTGRAWLNEVGCWVFADGEAFHSSRDDLIKNVRPVVVVDPEDREQVERIYRGMWADTMDPDEMPQPGSTEYEEDIRALANSLREFASPKPPKPEEPKRYLSVVRLADGRRYWRWSAGDVHTGHPWRLLGAVHADTEDDGNFRWSDLDVVEVESDGIEAS